MIKAGTASDIFSVRDSSGVLADPDNAALPVGTLYINAAANAATVTVAKLATGKYSWSVTVPSVADGDRVSLWLSCTVDGLSYGINIFRDQGATKLIADLHDATQLTQRDNPDNADIQRLAALLEYVSGTSGPERLKAAALTQVPAVVIPEGIATSQNVTDAQAAIIEAISEKPVTEIPAGLATGTEVETAQETIVEAVASVRGSGRVNWPYQITDSSGNPIADVQVVISIDSIKSNIVAGPIYTDAFGVIIGGFMLDPGIYYVWRSKAGGTFVNPLQVEVPA